MSTALVPQSSAPSGFGLMLNPESIEAAKDFAKTLANSGLVPQAFAGKPDAILIAGAMGHRLGLDIFSALAGIAVVNGRPTLWGDAQLAVCQAHPAWAGMSVAWSGEGDSTACTVTVSRKNMPDTSASFSIEDAIQAGLWGKAGPWKQYPRRMVELRARAFALRAAFADALAGFQAREEVEDYEDVTHRATVLPEPAAAKIRTVETSSAAGAVDQVAPDSQQEKATDPAPVEEVTHATNDAKAKALYAQFGKLFLAEVKKLNEALGVTKLSSVTANQLKDARDGLDEIEVTLNKVAI